MSSKIKIFITTFVLVIIILGLFFWFTRNETVTPTGTTPWYQSFNPFGTGGENTINPVPPDVIDPENPINPDTPVVKNSKFYQITDFAVAGATFLEDSRLKDPSLPTQEPEVITTPISPTTKEGIKEIQTILNKELSLNPPLPVLGNFGKLTTQAVKDFQKLKGLPETGKIDTATTPYFVKTTTKQSAVSLYEQAPSVRYVERMNGHIYKMFLDTKTKEKISNSTIPSIYESFFDKTAQTVIYRYLSEGKEINSFMATLGAPKGEFLPPDAYSLSVSEDKTGFFYLTKNSEGSSGTIGKFGETKREIVFSSPFTEWLSQWTSDQNIFLTTKPSYSASGSIFQLNPTNKTLTKIFGGIVGLTTLVNPNNSLVLYSTSTSSGPKLGIFNIAKHETKDLGVYGFPEKCVWSSDNISIYCAIPNTVVRNQYPDVWYQGLVSFDDYFVKINTNTGDKTTIANSINETSVDGIYLFLDKTLNNLFFINKKDSTLWGLNLK